MLDLGKKGKNNIETNRKKGHIETSISFWKSKFPLQIFFLVKFGCYRLNSTKKYFSDFLPTFWIIPLKICPIRFIILEIGHFRAGKISFWLHIWIPHIKILPGTKFQIHITCQSPNILKRKIHNGGFYPVRPNVRTPIFSEPLKIDRSNFQNFMFS